MMRVGVLALQGAVNEHLSSLRQLGIDAVAIKVPKALDKVDALIIPGGESTAMSRLMKSVKMDDAIKAFSVTHPLLGTCAGLILCSKTIEDNSSDVTPLGLLDITVRRNGFGRQVDSFETHLSVNGVGDDIPAVFIRAPFILEVGCGVEILATYDNHVVAAKQGHIWVCSFHPELTSDTRFLQTFIQQTT